MAGLRGVPCHSMPGQPEATLQAMPPHPEESIRGALLLPRFLSARSCVGDLEWPGIWLIRTVGHSKCRATRQNWSLTTQAVTDALLTIRDYVIWTKLVAIR